MTDPLGEAQQEFLRQALDGGGEAVRRIREFGEDYLGIARELWKLVESRAASEPGVSPQAFRASLDHLHDGLKEKFERLHVPVFGPLQAQQQATEQLMAATLRWQRASSRLGELLSAAATAAVENLVVALANAPATAPPITSLRQLHDLWVDCGERAYGEVAHSDDFAAAQCKLLSAMVEMRFEQRRVIEEWARAFNLPTRAEIDAIHGRLHELARVLREELKR
ncbi:MAG: hypothetical protein OEW16_01015 [Gammaproteobacteria bacterium]|nr:hypothetical protein [Gammaproteobacteria bacterium]